MILDNGIYDVEEYVDEGPKYEMVSDIRRIIDRVINSDYWRARSPMTCVELGLAEDQETGAYKHRRAYGIIYIWRPMSKLDILHELGHFLAWVPGFTHRVHHNKAFLRAYVGLVYEFMGRKTGDKLRDRILETKIYGYTALHNFEP